jgi:triosephosphate isomerase
MKRKPILAGNWKMYKTRGEAKAFVHELAPLVKDALCRVLIAPPFTALAAAASSAHGSSLEVGAQNMHDAENGPFTGEISAVMLREAGARFVILGHSERRQIFQESNAFISRKIKSALNAGLQPILCIGETREERDLGKTEETLSNQLSECLGETSSSELILAYEPVWAIGTGEMATPEMAQEVHRFCRKWLAKKWGESLSEQIPLLYGGSVKPETLQSLMKMPDIDGALVGGAALDLVSFANMINLLK